MATRRERKHPSILVSGTVPLDERLPRWEAELIVAVLARLAAAQPTKTDEATDAAS
jgi:hypothetical protein